MKVYVSIINTLNAAQVAIAAIEEYKCKDLPAPDRLNTMRYCEAMRTQLINDISLNKKLYILYLSGLRIAADIVPGLIHIVYKPVQGIVSFVYNACINLSNLPVVDACIYTSPVNSIV